MSNKIMKIQTITGEILVPIKHTNGSLNVVEVPTHNPILRLYNTVHSNGLRIPNSDTANEHSAIYICDSLAQRFPELANSDPQLSNTLKAEIGDFLEWVQGKDHE